MFNLKNIRAGILMSAIVSLFSVNHIFGQSTPTGGNLYGQPVNGSFGGDFDNFFISTPDEIYRNTFQGTFSPIYKHPNGVHFGGTSVSYLGGHKFIVHVFLTNGTILDLNIDYDLAHLRYYVVSADLNPAPTDSSAWKKLKGDALYALGTPWSSSMPIVYVSRDTLKTWQIDTTGINDAKIQDINLDTAQYVYAATDHGLFKQNPDSNAWHKVTSFTQTTNLYSVFVDRKNRILVGGNGGGLYQSTDNGASWNSDASGVGSNQVLLITDDAYNNLYITAGTSIFSFGAHIYKSTGGTSSWQEIDSSISRIVSSTSFQNMQINSLSGDSLLIAGTSFGVFLSTDQGTTWTMNNNGIKAENFTGMAKTGSGKILLSSALGIFSNAPPDTVWNKTYPQNGYEGQLPLMGDGLGNVYTLDPEIFLPSGNGAVPIVKSTDDGSSWSPDTAGLSQVNGGLFYVDETGAQHYGGGHQFFGTNPDLWTKPHGGSWTIDTTGFPTQSTNYVACMTSDRNGFLYISGNLSGKKVMRRPVSGGTWVVDTSGMPSSVPSFVQMVPGTNGDVFAVDGPSGSGIMRRSGGTWSTLPLPVSPSPSYVTALSVDDSGVVFAGFADGNYMGLGVYFTTDSGSSWTYDGLDSIIVTSLLSFGDSTYALTDGEGAFYVGKSPALTVVEKKTDSPNSFALYQNYPNPFNPTTVISYQLSVVSHVTLRVYDILGREVATLVDEKQNGGTHQVKFDGSQFASGLYFYRLSAAGRVRVSKMLLLK